MKEFYKHSKDYRWAVNHTHIKFANHKDDYRKCLWKPGLRYYKFILDKVITIYLNIVHKDYISSYYITIPYKRKKKYSNCT